MPTIENYKEQKVIYETNTQNNHVNLSEHM